MNIDFGLTNCVIGQKQSGKTNLLIYFGKIAEKQGYLGFIYDIVGNFKNYFPTIEMSEINSKSTGVFRIVGRLSIKHFEMFCANVLLKRKCFVIVDEVHNLIQKNTLVYNPNVNVLVTVGANYGVGSFFAAQRYQVIDNNIIANSESIFIGRTFLPSDLDIAVKLLGETYREVLPVLKYEFFMYQNGEITKLTAIPKMK